MDKPIIMKQLSIITILLSISAMCFGQLDTPSIDPKPGEVVDEITAQVDTITPTTYSQQALKQFVEELKIVGPKYEEAKKIVDQYNDLMGKITLVVSAYIDPKLWVGLTQDFKIIKK